MSTFRKAEKHQRKLRLAVFGASGSGKTYSALAIAQGFGGSVALIDTENSAELYADRFEFDIANLDKPTIENLLEFIKSATDYKVLIIDSLSHSWKELLAEVDKIATAKFKGNSWSAWSEGTPKQNKLITAITNFPGHIIVTMRSRTEWVIQQNDKGKSTPHRVGLAPQQGKDIEYEFDMLLEMNIDHTGMVIKDRTGKYQDKIIEKPGVEFGKELIAWLNSGKHESGDNGKFNAAVNPAPATEPKPAAKPKKTFLELCSGYAGYFKSHGLTEAYVKVLKEIGKSESAEKITEPATQAAVLAALKGIYQESLKKTA